MLELKKHQAALPKGSADWQDTEQEIQQTDASIDGLVYDLYGITEEERRIVEGETKK